MTRATLLHVLERPTALGPAEVRELEQLAQAFPYCQTAHLLLAKAAHDQGTMLAGQRLRRAATYAADRTLLRRLIEQEEPAAAPEPIVLPAPPHPLDLVDWPDEYVPPTASPAVAASLPIVPLPAPAPLVADDISLPTPPPAPAAPAVPELPELPELPAALPAATEVVAISVAPPVAATPAETAVVPMPEVEVASATAASDISIPAAAVEVMPAAAAAAVITAGSAIAASAIAEPAVITATVTKASPDPVAAAVPATEPLPVAPGISETTAQEFVTPEVAAPALTAVAVPSPVIEEPEAELPPQAPAIRPPVEVGEARFEFGLADPAPVAPAPSYELPGLVDEWAASAVTRSMGSPDTAAVVPVAPVVPVFTPAAFTGDAVVGYSFGESSRLGLSMQLLDLLTAKAEAAESNTAVVAAAQPPASALPPAGIFFEPDPLLLDHWATHRPAPPELPSTTDLINNFLKRQPRLTRPAMLPPAPGGQADLSVRSTRAEPDLVSENLARIFVRQGKTARAIEIYEKLMVKQPEKMAYFALQIQSLQPSA